MKKNEKNFMQGKKEGELNEKELDNVAGGFEFSVKKYSDFAEANGISKTTGKPISCTFNGKNAANEAFKWAFQELK